MQIQHLYVIEFGEPEGEGLFFRKKPDMIFVVATSFEIALAKATEYDIERDKSVLDEEGNLKLSYQYDGISSVKKVSDVVLI